MAQNNPFVRKSISYAKQIPRALKRLFATVDDYRNDPPILVNSFPKSGTHLLLQVLEALPGITNYGTFIASMPSITFKERSHGAHLRFLKNLIPREIAAAHLFYNQTYHEVLSKKNCFHFFIYRDLRDVALSEAHYLTSMNRWHRMHGYYAKRLSTLEERIATAIMGVDEPDYPYDYPNIATRFARYQGWLQTPDVIAIRFEDLSSDRRAEVLYQLVEPLTKNVVRDYEISAIVQQVADNINPSRSHTFREGKTGGWKEVFTSRHVEEMKLVAGDLLIQLGYEKDFDW